MYNQYVVHECSVNMRELIYFKAGSLECHLHKKIKALWCGIFNVQFGHPFERRSLSCEIKDPLPLLELFSLKWGRSFECGPLLTKAYLLWKGALIHKGVLIGRRVVN